MNIQDLKDQHRGRPAFCMGTAPHLNALNLELLKDELTIGCNQMVTLEDRIHFDYICIRKQSKFVDFAEDIHDRSNATIILPESILKQTDLTAAAAVDTDRFVPVHCRFTSRGHADFFSFDPTECVYSTDVIAMAIQLAVWMGCSPIYLLGVDAHFSTEGQSYFDDSVMPAQERDAIAKYSFPELRDWLEKTQRLLSTRGIRLYNAAGSHSLLDSLPRIRLEAAVGSPTIAVTSKTFSRDEYLVDELKRYFPNVRINDGSETLCGQTLIDFLSDADGVVLGTEALTEEVIEELPCLRFVSKYGVGLDNIDFKAAKSNLVEISYRKGLNSDSVAELTITLTLMLIRRIDESIQAYRQGHWKKLPGRELAEMTLGIIGYGHVGKVVASKFAALGIGRLLVNDLLDFPVVSPAESVPLDYLLKESDIVSLHVSMEGHNRHLVDESFIGRMKPGAYLVNTSRGEVVNETDLVTALEDGRLTGAAIDVYANEPEINPALADAPNLLTTCHIAGSSNRAIKNMGMATIEGLLRLFYREPV